MVTPTRAQGLQVEQVGATEIVTITMTSILEDETIRSLGEQLSSLVQPFIACQMVVNFAVVKRMSSPMLAKLVSLRKKIVDGGGRLVLCGLDPILYSVFEMTQLTRLFPIYPNEQDALQSF